MIRSKKGMKRSKINQVIKDMESLLRNQRFKIPSFGSWSVEDWKQVGHEYDEIRDNKLGWDITGDWIFFIHDPERKYENAGKI